MNQVYQVVAFTNIPSDARGPCELRFHIPPGYPVYYYPDSPGWAPLYSVYTLFYDDPSSISPNNRWSWNLLTTNNGMKKSGLWGSPQARATEYPQYVNSAV